MSFGIRSGDAYLVVSRESKPTTIAAINRACSTIAIVHLALGDQRSATPHAVHLNGFRVRRCRMPSVRALRFGQLRTPLIMVSDA